MSWMCQALFHVLRHGDRSSGDHVRRDLFRQGSGVATFFSIPFWKDQKCGSVDQISFLFVERNPEDEIKRTKCSHREGQRSMGSV